MKDRFPQHVKLDQRTDIPNVIPVIKNDILNILLLKSFKIKVR